MGQFPRYAPIYCMIGVGAGPHEEVEVGALLHDIQKCLHLHPQPQLPPVCHAYRCRHNGKPVRAEELDKFLDKERSVFPKRISKSLHIAHKPNGGTSQETASQPPQALQQDASMSAVITVEDSFALPPAISEEGNILQLVPVEQPLPVDPHPAKDMVPPDLPESPAASDETLITGEGAQEEATQSPGAKSQASGQSVGNKSQQGACQCVPLSARCGQMRISHTGEPGGGELIARTIIEDSRREGRLNRAQARRLHNSLLQAMERDSDALESLAHFYRKDLEQTAQHRERFYGYIEQLINVSRESVQEQRELRLAMYSRELGHKTIVPGSLPGTRKKKSKTQAALHSTLLTGSQILFGDSGDEGPALPCPLL
ncbi:hypothetical protein JD844_013943 [Phrynosoma platyrhinos]|uniref:Uncharacterized protein n=1 Tax=Phrynosoma platyrhinos TaxID=52577 RepID=A0ABQ7TLG2_PHRPL|nr:hypothetical protein JD844_013943 [Phrynosoma platyrhinos]